MGQFNKLLLAIDKAQKGPELHIRLRWVKQCLWAKPSCSLCLEYLC